VLELNKWQASGELTAEDQWMLFFRKLSIVESVFQSLPAGELIYLFGRQPRYLADKRHIAAAEVFHPTGYSHQSNEWAGTASFASGCNRK
jgi:hypothetical protein